MGRAKSDLKVVCYRLDGSLFRIYPSAEAAGRSGHRNSRTINKCIRGEVSTAFHYIWRRYPSNEIPSRIEPLIISPISRVSKPIAKITSSGEIIKTYPSIRKASIDNHIDAHSIRDNLNGKSNKTKVGIFRYLTDEEIIAFGY